MIDCVRFQWIQQELFRYVIRSTQTSTVSTKNQHSWVFTWACFPVGMWIERIIININYNSNFLTNLPHSKNCSPQCCMKRYVVFFQTYSHAVVTWNSCIPKTSWHTHRKQVCMGHWWISRDFHAAFTTLSCAFYWKLTWYSTAAV